MMADTDILDAPVTEEVDDNEGISNDLLSGADVESLTRALMLKKVIEAALASESGGAGKSPFTTQLDPFYGLQQGGHLRNPEYAPSSTGIKHLFLGGSPYPVSQKQEDAAKTYSNLALASNVTDVLGGLLNNRKEQGGGGIMDILKQLGIGGA